MTISALITPFSLRSRRHCGQNNDQNNASDDRANQQNGLAKSVDDLQRDRLPLLAGRSLLDEDDLPDNRRLGNVQSKVDVVPGGVRHPGDTIREPPTFDLRPRCAGADRKK
jgi:hypothetical protein